MFIRLIKSFLVNMVFWNPEHRAYAVELLKNGIFTFKLKDYLEPILILVNTVMCQICRSMISTYGDIGSSMCIRPSQET